MKYNLIQRLLLVLRNMKLQNKLITGYVLAGVIPILLVSIIIYHQSSSGLEDSSEEFATLYTSQIEASLNDFMRDYDKITKSVLVDNDILYRVGDEREMTMDELISQKGTVQRLLMRIALLKPEIDNLILVSRDKRLYHYSNTTSSINENALLSQKWFQRLLDTEDTFFITGLHDRSYYEDKGEGALVTVGRVLFNYDGSYAGILLMDMNPYTLLQLDNNFLKAREKYGISVIISGRDGETVYHSDAASGRHPWNEVMQGDVDSRGDRDAEDLIVINGKTQLGNLTIRTEIPRNELLQKISKVKFVTILVIIVGSLIMILISLALSYTITKPIKALRRSMKQAETGQYMPIEKDQAHDEIGSLVRSYNKMIVTIRSLIEDVYIADIKSRKAKLTSLQNQINPHMLYNTLESIRMKALVKEDEETATMIKILARMFRLTLGKEGRRHSIKDELEYTSNYLQLQNIRFDDKFRLDNRLPEEMQQCSIIPLVFQPIVENSIKHGYQDYNRVMNIVIEGDWAEDNGILIRITDDGLGVPAEKQLELCNMLGDAESDKYKLTPEDETTDQGLGLKNIAERIKLHYGERYYIMIRPGNPTGTTVEILIPKI
jgi:Predicted signal transduction protein with a C-terminal ATPase domain